MEIVGGEGFYRGFGLERLSATSRVRATTRFLKAIRRSFPANIYCETDL
jgi:hypothetical protein